MALMDTSAFTGNLFGILTTFLFWIVLICFLIIIAFLFLVIKKGRKLSVPIIECTSLGRGKFGIKSGKKLKGGWFKHKTTLFGLWDYGYEEVFRTKDKRKVLSVSSEDYHEINGKMGLLCMRSPEDPKILVPISKAKVENGDILFKIAPADYRSVVVDIVKSAEKETQDKIDKVMQYVFWGGIIIFSFIAIILITQMVKNGQAEAKDLILEAGRMNEQNLKNICGGVKSVGEAISSNAP